MTPKTLSQRLVAFEPRQVGTNFNLCVFLHAINSLDSVNARLENIPSDLSQSFAVLRKILASYVASKYANISP